MRTLHIPTLTHGRVLVQDPEAGEPTGTFLVCHGYAQTADEALSDALLIPGIDRWRIAAVQGLHCFYARDERVVAGWMTRQDRDLAIADNVAYLDRALADIHTGGRLAIAGFSQGVAMAYRAALLGRHRADVVIALAGDIPPELRTPDASPAAWPLVVIGVGSDEHWYTPDRLDLDLNWLRERAIDHRLCKFEGGHAWSQAFRDDVGKILAEFS